MVEFFYRCGRDEFGPLSSADLKKLAQSGRVTAADEIRQGRTGKWILAENVPGLFPRTTPRRDLSINEMDVVADIPSAANPDRGAGLISESDTAVDSEAESRELPAVRHRKSSSLPAQVPADPSSAALVQWATAVVAVCYVASALGLIVGVVMLLEERDLQHGIFAGVCFLVTLVGLAGGCTTSLLLSIRHQPPRT
ncbi:MAG: DUF4339 domain-containing protein [Deltaproteobacteria bacterium]